MHYILELGVATSTCFHCHCSLTGHYLHVYHYSTDEQRVRKLMLADIENVHVFTQTFLAFAPGTRYHLQWCSSAHRAMLMSGDVTALYFCTVTLLY